MVEPQSVQDTIVACATARQKAAIAVIRLSGTNSHAIAAKVAGKLTPVRRASLVHLHHSDGRVIDQALQLVFAAPHSFTGEDMIEWHCHGGMLVVDLLLDRALALGARAAQPGEFAKRAFLHGKIDLTQAEAIAGLIEAGSRRVAHLAASSLAEGLARPLAGLGEGIDWCRSQIEARLDFSDEPIEPAELLPVGKRLAECQRRLATLIQRAEKNLVYAHSPQIVLAGEPNTGKSSLFNRLLGEERALVNEQAGTTRDLLRESLRCGDAGFRLADSAGLRQSADPIERAGIQLAYDQLVASDIILLVFDARHRPPAALWQQIAAALADRDSALSPPRLCLVANKIDLSTQRPALGKEMLDRSVPCVWLSAKSGAGVDLLRQWLLDNTQAPMEEEDAFLVRQRHLDELVAALQHLKDAREQLTFGEANLELAAESLRLAGVAMGRLNGSSTSEELLGQIFGQFCIGK